MGGAAVVLMVKCTRRMVLKKRKGGGREGGRPFFYQVLHPVVKVPITFCVHKKVTHSLPMHENTMNDSVK